MHGQRIGMRHEALAAAALCMPAQPTVLWILLPAPLRVAIPGPVKYFS
jgi:hypothetical protein